MSISFHWFGQKYGIQIFQARSWFVTSSVRLSSLEPQEHPKFSSVYVLYSPITVLVRSEPWSAHLRIPMMSITGLGPGRSASDSDCYEDISLRVVFVWMFQPQWFCHRWRYGRVQSFINHWNKREVCRNKKTYKFGVEVKGQTKTRFPAFQIWTL